MAEADAVGEGVDEQIAEHVCVQFGRGAGVLAHAAAPLARGGVDGRQAAAMRIARHAPVAERRQGAPARGQAIAGLA